jgi:superfamily II DNA or RNA helicase
MSYTYDNILNKEEFVNNSSDKKKNYIHQEPSQILLRNYISKVTPYENILVYHGLGVGKCHQKDTPILMHDGTIKKVQDIETGEYLMGDDSNPRKVSSLARGTDMMYDIIPVKGESYIVNKEHILCLKVSGFPKFSHSLINNNYNIQWVKDNKYHSKTFTYNTKNKNEKKKQADNFFKSIKNEQILEISVKDYLNLSNKRKSNLKGYRSGVDFNYTQVPFDPYIVGYWLGDGTARGSSITTQDSTVLHYIREKLPNLNLHLSKLQDKYSYGITGNGNIGGNPFLITLKNLNLINNKHIPYIYKCNDRRIRLAILAGILDADGYYIHNSFELTQSIKHEKLIDDVVYLARSLGFACYKKKKNTSWTYKGVKKTGEAWRIIISGKGIEDIPTVIPRKKATIRKQIKDVLVTGITVKPVGINEYYGFTLDGNCRYLMGDFTVTHNTCASITIAEGFKEYINNMNNKIFVLVKNKNIQNNFMDELLSQCTGDDYIDNSELQKIEGTKINKVIAEENNKDIMKKAKNSILENYQFSTYGTFVNRVLGSKIYEKDEFGQSTKKLQRDSENNVIRRITRDQIKTLNNTVVIVDEAHNIVGNDIYDALFKVLSNSYNCRLVLLTATPMTDNPSSIFELSNLLNIKDKSLQLPIRKKLFEKENQFLIKESSKYLYKNGLKGGIARITEYGLNAIKKCIIGKVSYLKTNIKTNPRVISMGNPLYEGSFLNVVFCEMSDYQYNIYKKALETDTNIYTSIDIVNSISNIQQEENLIELEEDTTFSKTNSLYKNSSDASTIVYPEETYGKVGFSEFTSKNKIGGIFTKDLYKYSSKLYNLMNNINKKDSGKIFIYSNYVDFGGTSLIKLMLSENKYFDFSNSRTSKEKNYKRFIVFDGKTSVNERERYKNIFNSPENKDGKLIRIIIGSPMISEGITLKEIRQVHILEPSWNMSSINQIIGRAVRNYSHHLLEPNERNVEIYKYASVYKDTFSIDKEKYILCEEKDKSNKVVERLLKTSSFDCYLNKSRNIIENGIPGSAECDYTDCEYKCDYEKNEAKLNIELDKSTYNLYVSFFDQYDIKFIINKIGELFKKDFIWSLDDIFKFIHSFEPLITSEAIYTALNNIVKEKMYFVDKYNRGGFIINRGPYYIFNNFDIDIDSSLYSKMLDFSIEKNKYNLNDFMKKIFNEKEPEPTIFSTTEQITATETATETATATTGTTTDTTTETTSTVDTEDYKLTLSDIEYNENIEKTFKIYGTYRKSKVPKKDKWEHKYGKKDGVFRIVDARDLKNKTDAREEMTGKAATSYKVDDLKKITEFLEKDNNVWDNIKKELGINKKKLQKVDYANMIEIFLKNKNGILK